MITTRTVLVSIAGSWNRSRNIGNFVPTELGILEAQVEMGNVRIVQRDNNSWAELTDPGQELLYYLNGNNETS
jgi:hypothetical protein